MRKTIHKTKLVKVLLAGIAFYSALALAQAKHDWPVEITGPNGKIDIYQPQPESLQGNILSGRTAVSVTIGDKAPVFGAMWFTAQLQTDLDKRTFELLSVKVTRVKFPQATSSQEQQFTDIIEKSVHSHAFKGSLDSLLATLASAQKEQQAADKLKTDPPKIVFVKYQAVLVLIDGEPRLQTIEGSKIMRVVNTPMLMVFDPSTKKYYLSSGSVWYSVTDILGAWQIDHNPPQEIARMVTDQDGKQVASSIPDAQMPRIIVSKVPTELIYSDGEPQYTPIPGTNLLYMSNTENDVFMNIDDQKYYALISGRWFTSSSLIKGPWSYVAANKLPGDFAKIPADSAKANVLASVASTPQAQEALIEEQVPQTATVNRNTHFTVTYDGQPQFKKISGTDMQYAVNTTTPVVLAQGKYYACDSAIWFVAPTPNGPWNVADSIPSEINNIPPDCPIYNVKYVYIYGSTPDVVYVGYTPGYLGFYPYYGTVVYGTGFVYAPVYVGPIYYPPPVTYGFAVHYNPYTNSWAFGVRVSYGFTTVAFGWHSYWYHGYYPWHPYYPPKPPHWVYGRNNVNINVARQININNNTINVNRQINNNINVYNNPRNANRLVSQGTQRTYPQAQANRSKPNNVITDKEGNVYRNNGKKGWEKNDNGKWASAKGASSSSVNKQTVKSNVSAQHQTKKTSNSTTEYHHTQQHTVPNQVVEDYQARQSGANRATSFSSSSPSGSSMRAPSSSPRMPKR